MMTRLLCQSSPLLLLLLSGWFLLPWQSLFVCAFSPSSVAVAVAGGRSSSSSCRSGVLFGQKLEEYDGSVEVVLFGMGDYRVDDHGGLRAALDSGNAIFLLAVVSTNEEGDELECLAVQSLQQELKNVCDLELHVTHDLPNALSSLSSSLSSSSSKKTLHVCDLGWIDNQLSNNPIFQLQQHGIDTNTDDDATWNVQSWNCHLRQEPWKDQQLQQPLYTDRYPQYQKQTIQTIPVTLPQTLSTTTTTTTYTSRQATLSSDHWTTTLPQPNPNTDTTTSTANVGLYGTHWGGLDIATTFNESFCRKVLQDPSCVDWSSKHLLRKNPLSLEHATMSFQHSTNTLLPSETLTRFLLAPVLYGLVSPRQVWHTTTTTCQEWMESREWHQLLAASQQQQQQQQQQSNKDTTTTSNGQYQYNYWRWHGFLCRYLQPYTNTSTSTSTNTSEHPKQQQQQQQQQQQFENTPKFVWVHGFGASSKQIEPCLQYLKHNLQVWAPDLLGFGHCEKPPITYTQYLWSMYVFNFIQTFIHGDYVLSGNSIGGYTALMTAADSTATAHQCSSSGATTTTTSNTSTNNKGKNHCAGLILMNSAGRIAETDEQPSIPSVAQQTIQMDLPKPFLPQWVARLGGNALLAYLRPNIQKICTNLYPTNPLAVTHDLCDAILRDSLDVGAINVMVSGSKLPPPRTINDILTTTSEDETANNNQEEESQFSGPVLVAQGLLDPLNDATTRAHQIQSMRTDNTITLTPLQAGHCPHDELPQQMAEGITNWITSALVPPSNNNNNNNNNNNKAQVSST